jgi:hypothetical protein
MNHPQDTHIGRQVLRRNLDRIEAVTLTKGMTETTCVKNFGRSTFDQ